ncbi:MAG: hypothetical protein H6934_08165 [Burkholderiaceae bacterium]|nr:hypothetical protein [Burkholderiaceae bacterium]
MKGATGPIVLILIGVVFLLDKLGYVPLHQLGPTLRSWWPVVLIVVGVAMLIRRRS